MRDKLKPKSEFSKNVLTLMTGTTIAQAIPIAISPILTRLYSPEDFGVFALFIAIVSVFAVFINGRYELAIMLPKKDEDAINIFALAFIINLTITIFTFLLVIFFSEYIVLLLKNKEIKIWLYFLPLTIFFIGIWNILTYFNNRKKNYKDMKNATIIKSIILAIVQLSIGFLKQGVSGLILGQVLSNMFANIKLIKNILKNKLLISKISKVKIITVAKKYKNFPIFFTWAGLANILSIHLINILISIYYGISTLGYYALVSRVLVVPSWIIGNSIGNVFFQVASEEKIKKGTSLNSFKHTLKKLLILSIIIFIPTYFIIDDLFLFVFGKNWEVAGEYAKILTPMIAIKFIVSPLAKINQIYMKNLNVLLWQIGLLLLNILIILFSYFLKIDFINYLYILVLVITLYYIFHLYLIYGYIQKGK